MNTLLIASAMLSMAHAAVYHQVGTYRDDKCASVPSLYQLYSLPSGAPCLVTPDQGCWNVGGLVTGADPFNMFVKPTCSQDTQSTPQSIVESKFQGKEYFQQQIYADDKCENLGLVQGNLANECMELGPYMSGKITVNTDGSVQLEYFYQAKNCKGNKFNETLPSSLLKGECLNLAEILPGANTSSIFNMVLQSTPMRSNVNATVRLSIVKPAHQARISGASSLFNMSIVGSILLLVASV